MPITEDDKDFPKNLMFVYQMRRWVPPPEKKGKWVLSKDKRNCYFHSEDLGCLRRVAELEQLFFFLFLAISSRLFRLLYIITNYMSICQQFKLFIIANCSVY